MSMSPLGTINLERDFPSVEEARVLLTTELARARQQRCSAVTVIHGYGSTGVGGKLRLAIRESLIRRRKRKEIRAVVFGENWDIFNSTTQAVLDLCPELKRDTNLQNGNPGISIVVF